MVRYFERRHSPATRIAALAAPAIEFLLFVVLVASGNMSLESAVTLIAPLATASLLHAWFVLGTHYELTTSTLRVVHGPGRRNIALADVLSALPLRTLDRGPVVQLKLAYRRELRVMPADRRAFLDALEGATPHLEVHAIEAATRSAG